jgi:HEAT repeat protein
MRRLSLHVVLAAIALFCNSAHAQGENKEPPKKEPPKKEDAKPKPTDARRPSIDVKPLVPKLESGDEAQIRSALDEVRIAGPAGAPAAPAIAKALSQGLSFALAQSAIETLGEAESEAGSAVLAQYASHRDPKLRRAAVKALTRTKGAAAAAALRRSLSDPDAVVRGTAASGLGTLKAKDAVPDLFVALDHRVNEAAASLGMLCNVEQCDQLAAKLGKLPFDVVTGGLDQVLFRPTAEISDDAKIKVIGRIRELGTIEANKFLREVQKRWPQGSSPRVRQSIDQAVLATSGGAQ